MDDVITTGSTLFECLEVLRRQGAGGGLPMAVALA
jgi:predicted amidophosphoribosyltransferase